MSSASAYSVSWFGLIQLPDLIAPDEIWENRLKELHEWLARILFVLAVLHVGAALKHALVDRDGILARMLSWPALAAALAIVGAGTVYVLPSNVPQSVEEPVLAGSPAAAVSVERDMADSAPAWDIDAEASFIEFIGNHQDFVLKVGLSSKF